MRASSGLKLSIVIASWNGDAALASCLDSIGPEGRAGDTEVIIASNFRTDRLRTAFPGFQFVTMAAGTTVPALRTAGIKRSAGEIIALTEDNCVFDKNWCLELRRAHELPYSVIGGPVENASVYRTLDWAVYFYDYGKFMLPRAAGLVSSLSGANVSYKRTALLEAASSFQDGFFEPFTHGALVKRGHSLYFAPLMVVYHGKSYGSGYALAQAYHLARGFAGKRVSDSPWATRGMFAAGSLALPAVLPGRIIANILRKRRNVGALLMSLPYLLLLTTSWSFGEFCGYLGGAGHSGAEWK